MLVFHLTPSAITGLLSKKLLVRKGRKKQSMMVDEKPTTWRSVEMGDSRAERMESKRKAARRRVRPTKIGRAHV